MVFRGVQQLILIIASASADASADMSADKFRTNFFYVLFFANYGIINKIKIILIVFRRSVGLVWFLVVMLSCSFEVRFACFRKQSWSTLTGD